MIGCDRPKFCDEKLVSELFLHCVQPAKFSKCSNNFEALNTLPTHKIFPLKLSLKNFYELLRSHTKAITEFYDSKVSQALLSKLIINKADSAKNDF